MNLLSDFQAPETTRLIWHSPKDQATWESRLTEINRRWADAERMAVAMCVKPAALQPMTRDEYMMVLPWAAQHGLFVRVVRTVGHFEGFAQSYRPGSDLFVTAITSEPEMLEQPEQHLGYPECCVLRFEGLAPIILDPVWQWAGERRALGQVSPYTNPMLRYWNIRFAPHLPCSAGCEQSEQLGQAMRKAMAPHVAEWVEELLSMPIEWDCYRGLALVKTPPFRLVVGSVPCADRYVVNVN